MVPISSVQSNTIDQLDIPSKQTLERLGIRSSDIDYLRATGVLPHKIEVPSGEELGKHQDLSSPQRENYYQKPVKRVSNSIFQSAHDLLQDKKETDFFCTGYSPLDDILMVPEYHSFGIRMGEIYEIYGEHKTGKTQLVHQLAITAQLPVKVGGVGKKVVYMDTEGTFSPSRIMQISRYILDTYNCDLSIDHILKNILYARASSTTRQFQLSYELIKILQNQSQDYGLIIVDSATPNFRAEYIGRDQLVTRQQLLNSYLSLLQQIAYSFNVTVVVTNQVVTNPDEYFGGINLPVGGHIMAHWPTHRLSIRKSRGKQRVLRIEDSPVYGNLETVFEISKNGIGHPNNLS